MKRNSKTAKAATEFPNADGLAASQRVVTSLPLQELWSESGAHLGRRINELNESAIRALLSESRPAVVVANVGDPLCWIPADEIFSFLKAGAYGRIVDDDTIRLEDFRGEFCYAASLWTTRSDGERVILLEKWH